MPLGRATSEISSSPDGMGRTGHGLLVIIAIMLFAILPMMTMAILAEDSDHGGATGPSSRQASAIELVSSPAMRQVEPGTAATFSLNIKNGGTSLDVITLEITAMPTNWTVTFSDDSIELDPGESDTATVSIRPSKEALASQEEFTIGGVSAIGQGSASVKIAVHVKQIFDVDIDVPDPGTVSAGGSTKMSVTVLNGGNGPDTINLKVIPIGEATSWASTFSKDLEVEAGKSVVQEVPFSTPADTDGGQYSFTVRAKSMGGDAEASEQVRILVKGAPSSGFTLDTRTLLVIIMIVIIVMALLAAIFTPSRPKQPQPQASVEDIKSAGDAPTTPVQKVRKRKRRVLKADHDKKLERIEKRIEDLHRSHERLHEHILQIQSDHNQHMSHFQLHLIRHHDGEVVDGGEGEEDRGPGKEAGSGDEETAKGARPVDESPKELPGPMEPGPVDEGVPPEGPPENMSVGDEQGEIRPKQEQGEGVTSIKRKCPRCSGEIEEDWIRCAHCGYLL